MVNPDPSRTPTFTMFANPDFFFQTFPPSCGGNPCVNPGFAWNHGDFQSEIGNTWVGIAGPGVQSRGIDAQTWTDHTNLRPTILTLVVVIRGMLNVHTRQITEGELAKGFSVMRRQHQADHLRVEPLGLQPDRKEGQLDTAHDEEAGIERRQARRETVLYET